MGASVVAALDVMSGPVFMVIGLCLIGVAFGFAGLLGLFERGRS